MSSNRCRASNKILMFDISIEICAAFQISITHQNALLARSISECYHNKKFNVRSSKQTMEKWKQVAFAYRDRQYILN